ncbi:conserved Plasmodium protein, unknown function [Plasmodium berghei]|uniref:Uncharacterized protein n=2 Tax=Plasmodium berghei TaxID=5821 RepID=A0A509B0L4_PLABA|nr:conserved Plasmodium protein, unknown function [Plasmodium berghei ANKA]CXJ21528.1 conserved Plasmodium protein, unknown function [Plasmodium berghei]SCM26602.1 conserved Plasmodium protein, unknown function [Plasmodium berghei]SCN28542.1 conserved Plasmodium protein, unknown function [Plasmodium berghei]SCO62731.1 conserved Plasmodium protein, unknown function [Plasmodium berghei]SCO64291.1 conserved Plasmodium protein, unknown function [Plasmodium berghei]|eukprot:XP_034424187.1 conserved Plasmodium protein, unknown function [Plasmodium berghei ANKA]
MKKSIIVLLALSLYVKTLLGTQIERNINSHFTNKTDIDPQLVIAVNKPHIMNNFNTYENNEDQMNEEKAKAENFIRAAKELLHIIEENKNELLGYSIAKELGLEIKTEIMNGNDENVLKLLLNNKNSGLKNTKPGAAPVIVMLPQHLSNEELLYYNNYVFKKNVKNTKNLLLKVSYLEKIAKIKSIKKNETIDELEKTAENIERCLSRKQAIEDKLEEILHADYQMNNKNIKRLKGEMDFLNIKINVLRQKTKKLHLVN